MKGRKPRPTALKLLAGERPDRIHAGEPIPPPGLPVCPEHLDTEARREWERIVPILAALGVLAEVDGAALALYCDAFSRWVEARRELAAHGLVCVTDLGGVKANPAAAIARDMMALMHKLLTEFGATPAARSKVSVPSEGPKDELSEFLARKRG